MNNELIFVYGTLRQGTASPMEKLLARHCTFVAEAFLQGILYDLGGYPGVIESANPTDKVLGELYQIERGYQLWPRLDHYEQCTIDFTEPHEYVRRKRSVLLNHGEQVQAWVYLFNWRADDLVKIASGDYLSYLNNCDQVR
jgi:gamma-glutamylcyclotransferase (GGCT)/AIG2-like uncharacterized protein YtfP